MLTLCIICIKFRWVCGCALFCPLWMWGLNPAIYISFFFSLYNAAFSACLNTYSMRYILACWISWYWKCCMECYNKVIFFYKLQLKWFVLFFMGIWWTDAEAVCTVFAIYVGHFVLLHCTAVTGSCNNNAHVVFLECTKRACFHVASFQFDIGCFILVVFVFQTERRPEDLGNNRLFNGRERTGQGKSIHQPSSINWSILIINTNVLDQKQKVCTHMQL